MNAHLSSASVIASGTQRAAPRDHERPLCVDLDGTLIGSDAMMETLIRYLKPNPLRVFRVGAWLLRGIAHLKAQLAQQVELDVPTLPVHEGFLGWLRAEHGAGRKLILCTAANETVAARIAAYFGVFDEVIASSAVINLSGRTKAERLVARFGVRGFDYAGNERKDLHVWTQAHSAVIVAPRRLLRRLSTQPISIERSFAIESGDARSWLRALRLHQWSKNLLLFVPLAAAHRLDDVDALLACALAFLLFGLCASGGYLINDLLDLDADRAHPRKRLRPFASGGIPLVHGIIVACLLISGSIALALLALPLAFAATLLIYLATSLWYSLALKRIAMVDVLSLAGLYSVRIIAGGAAVNIEPSFWLLAFSMFLFLSLAAAKRYAELRAVLDSGRTTAPGRGYAVTDLPMLHSSGTAAGYLAVLVMALYVNSGAGAMYARPQLMWMLCPLLLYWTNRIWLKTFRGQMHDDPVVFALTDRPSLIVFAMGAVLAWAAT